MPAGFTAEGNTALWDSVIFALHHLGGVQGQRALLLLTDGKDETSRFDFEQALAYARAMGTTIYTIGIGTDAVTRRRPVSSPPEVHTMQAIRAHEHGGPEVLRVEEVPLPEPREGEARVRIRLAGVNFIDVYRRTGFYPVPSLPAIPGGEGAGVVDAVGPGVTEVAEGDRVAFWDAPGAYAQAVVHRAERLLPLPDGTGFEAGAALPLQGMTAHYLTHTIGRLGPGDTVLIHAAAGGVGLLAVQMAKLAGATVIGTCSTEEKAERARAAGADHVIRYTEEDFVEETKRLTGGAGVDLAIDGVGRATFEGSVAATRVRGQIVLFGQASGAPDPVQPRKLLGSRTLTTASLFDYSRDRGEMLERAARVFGWHAKGRLQVHVDRVLPLAEAAQAHQLLEGRATSGKLLLEPPG